MDTLVDRTLALTSGTPALAKDVFETVKAKPDDATRQALWGKAQAAAKAANDSCGTAPETAAAGTLLTHAMRLSALAGKFDEAYDGLAAYPLKNSVAYSQNALLPLGQYLLGEGMVEEARRFRDRLLTEDLWAALKDDDGTRNVLAQLVMWAAEDRVQWEKALAASFGEDKPSASEFSPGERSARAGEERSLVHAGGTRAVCARRLDQALCARRHAGEVLHRRTLCAQSAGQGSGRQSRGRLSQDQGREPTPVNHIAYAAHGHSGECARHLGADHHDRRRRSHDARFLRSQRQELVVPVRA